MTEDAILSRCHVWCWNSYPELRGCFWHVANERKQSALQGAIMKAKGVVSGVPDYVFNFNGKTVYFEFKNENGILSENQKKVIKSLENQNFTVHIIRDFETFKKIIQNIILSK